MQIFITSTLALITAIITAAKIKSAILDWRKRDLPGTVFVPVPISTG